MPITGIRPAGADTPFYNPHRDLAWTYAPMAAEAFWSMSDENWGGLTAELAGALSTTREAVQDAAAKFAEAHLLFCRPDAVSMDIALETSGFSACPAAARAVVLARIGEVIAGGFWSAVRDVTYEDSVPPQLTDLAAMVAAATAGIRRHSTEFAAAAAEGPQALEAARIELRERREECERLDRKLRGASNEAVVATRRIKRILGAAWWRRIKIAFRYVFFKQLP